MKKRLLLRKRAWMLAVLVLCTSALVFGCQLTASADMPYETYSYNYYGEVVSQPHVYLFEKTLPFLGNPLKNPQDMFVAEDGTFYIADTGNSRILKVNLAQEVLLTIDCAKNSSDPLNKPQGIFVTEEGHIFVADSGNGRLVEYDADGKYIREIGRPVTELIEDSVVYTPQKVVVDHDGRIYVSAYGINLGLLEFSSEGDFQSFMGAAKVSVSAFEYAWKTYFSTDEQKARMATIVPTEYSNIFVDSQNFIYATISNLSEDDIKNGADMIRRLNPTGNDILRRLGNMNIAGDGAVPGSKSSSFVDVAATDYGCYFVLDNANGKVFGYDYDGNSLFAFGRNGTREGNVQNAVAIGITPDAGQLYLLDYQMGSILVYGLTEYGDHLLSALRLNDLGDSDGSIAEWRAVLQLNSNSEFAYIGLGKNYLAEGEYKTAMEYFKNGNNRKYYSKALYYYRKQLMEQHFGTIMAVLAVVILIPIVISQVRKFKRWREKVEWVMSKN